MNSIETSIHPLLLALGLVASVTLFLLLLRRELLEQSRFVRFSISGCRIILCLLVWWLIAQPRAVTKREETLPLSFNLGIDVSDSMSLADQDGATTSTWNENSAPSALDEAITQTEAAKIRLNLLSKRLESSDAKIDSEIKKTIEILSKAKTKTETYGRDSGLERLTSSPQAKIADAIECLKNTRAQKPGSDLTRSATLAAEAALGLRRVAVLASEQHTGNKSVQSLQRIDLVNRWLEKSKPTLKRLTDENNLRTFTFASDLTRVERNAEINISGNNSAETRLYENLNRLAEKSQTKGSQAVFLITDGVDSSQTNLSEFSADARNQPLIVLPIGDHDNSPDTQIVSVVSPAQVRENDMFVAIADVSSRNTGPITVTVNLSDKQGVLTSREVELKGDGSSTRVELQWKANLPGTKEMEVTVVPLKNEKLTHNNNRLLTCTVSKDRYRILLCDSFPQWETRYLLNLFRRDASIELASIIFEPRHTFPGNDPVEQPTLPLSLESWQKFDIVILGDMNPTQLTRKHQELIVNYVNRGGNLLLLAGKNHMPAAFVGAPLEDLLPMTAVQTEELKGTFVIFPPEDRSVSSMVKISESNSSSQWKSIFTTAPRHQISQWAKAKQSAQTLLVAKDASTGTTYDFFSMQRYGRGRVAFAAAPCFYHLRFSQGDRYHLRFWGKFIRGMCVDEFGFEGGMVKTRLDRQLWLKGSEVQGRVRITDIQDTPIHNAVFSAVLTRDGASVARMIPAADPEKPGEYFIRFPKLPPGEYTIAYEGDQVGKLWEMDRQNQPDPPECRFQVIEVSDTKERQFASEIPDFWSHINRLPLAATIHPKTLPLMLDAIRQQPETISIVQSRSIWDTWTLLSAIIIVSGLEWLLRRTRGLC